MDLLHDKAEEKTKNQVLGISVRCFFNTQITERTGNADERMFGMSFKTIETQEELDNIIKERLARQKQTYEEQLKGYDQLKTQYEELQKEAAGFKSALDEATQKASTSEQSIADLQSKVTSYEQAQLRTKIALQQGLPFELADRLAGTNEDELTADAERLAGFLTSKEPTAPLKSVEEPGITGENAAYRAMLQNLSKD